MQTSTLRIRTRRALAAVTALVPVALFLPVSTAAPASAAVSTTCAAQTGRQWTRAEWSSSRTLRYSTATKWCSYSVLAHRRMVWQSDGNLVSYSSEYSGGGATWSSNTSGRGTQIVMQTDGNVVIYDSAGRSLWSSGSANKYAGAHTFGFGVDQFGGSKLAYVTYIDIDRDVVYWNV